MERKAGKQGAGKAAPPLHHTWVSAGCVLETRFRMSSSVRTSGRRLMISQLYLVVHKPESRRLSLRL